MFVYADHAATTPTDPRVAEVMAPYWTEIYGNPNSIHGKGREARRAIDEARARIAKVLNADSNEIYFTSCGTESDNWAIRGTAYRHIKKGKHLITSNIEHHAVLHTMKALEKEGFEVTYLPVDENGFVSAQQLEQAIRPDTTLVSVMMANNEIGSIQPIAELAAVAKSHKVAFHTDAVQAVGHIPVDVRALGVDMLSLSGHKFNAPKGIGVLYLRRGVLLPNLMFGGGQERTKRPGTENTAYIMALAKALELAVEDLEGKMAYTARLRDRLMEGILNSIPHCRRNSPVQNCLPGMVNVSIRYIEGESLLLMLDMNGICASSGSACTSGELDPSHVLLALGLPHEIAHGSVRFSLAHTNTEAEIDYILEKLPEITAKLRAMSPLWNEG